IVRTNVRGAFYGNSSARHPVRFANDGEEPGIHHGGSPLPDAGDWGHNGDFYRGERRAASAAALLAPGAACSRLHGVSNVSKWRAAPVLDFGAGNYRFEA